MSNNIRKILKGIVIICIIILIVDLCVFISTKNKKSLKLSFDGINSFDDFNNSIIAVGSNNENINSYEKAKITKYDDKFNKVWEKRYNNKYSSSFSSVIVDDDSIVAVGSYEANKKEHDNKVRSALIVKYDKDGNMKLKKRFQVLGNSKFTKVIKVSDGYLVVGQSIYENMTLGFSDLGGAFLIKYDENLNEVWKKNYGGSKSAIYNDVVAFDNNIYVVGKDSSRLGILCKYSLDGEFIDNVDYEFTDTIGFTGLVINDDNIFVVGAKKVSNDNNNFDTDALIVKYDLDLEKIDEKTFSTSKKAMERYNSLIVDDSSNLVIIGHTGIYDSKNSTDSLNVFKYDGIFAKYSSDLEELSVDYYGKNNDEDDYFTYINKFNNNYLVSGYSTSGSSYNARFIEYTKSGKLVGFE